MRKSNQCGSKLAIEYLATNSFRPNRQNPRHHTDRQLTRLASIIEGVGWTAPIIVDEAGTVLAGHARLEAAKRLGMQAVPCVRLVGLSHAQKLAITIGDNKMTDESSWDPDRLRGMLIEITGLDFDVELTGFTTGEVDFTIDGPPVAVSQDPADTVPPIQSDRPAITMPGDLWLLDKHRLLCGSALEVPAYEALLGEDRAKAVFSDPPYNVPINGHVSGLGKTKHREFAMASGEMTDDQFRHFLNVDFQLAARFSVDGAIHYQCVDWRHVGAMLVAAEGVYSELINMCVWNKSNAGMGSFYRSKHELVLVFKVGTARQINNVHLGKHGRYRTNVWDYPGANAFGSTRDADLADHPTVKPTAMVADAIRDCTKRGGLVLDTFCGSGTTILAAERAGRRAAGIEIDPLYVDVAVRRWQKLTGQSAVLAGDGRSFAEIEAQRAAAATTSCSEEAGQ